MVGKTCFFFEKTFSSQKDTLAFTAMEKARLGGDDGMEICRLVTGLWQVADMERKEGTMSPAECATALHQ